MIEFQRGWHLKRFFTAFLWAVFWVGSCLAVIEFFYGPGEVFGQAHIGLLGGLSAIFCVAVPVSLGFFLARLLGLFRWRRRLQKQLRRYLRPEETGDPIPLLEKDLKCRLFGVTEIFLGREWVVFPGQVMKRDAIVGIYFTELSRFSLSQRLRITLVDDTGELISYEAPKGDGPACYDFLLATHPWVSRGDFREYTFFLQKEGDHPDWRKLRTPAKTTYLGVSRWDRNPILEENTISGQYERWLLASYAPYIAADPYLHGDFDHTGGWERTTLQERIAKSILRDPWDVTSKEELLDTVEHLMTTGQLSRDGWQLGRATMVLGLGYIAGYLTRRELLQSSLPVGEAIQKVFGSWQELHKSYLKSYESWAKGAKSRGLRRRAYEELLKDPASLLNTVPFRLDLQGRCRETLGAFPEEPTEAKP